MNNVMLDLETLGTDPDSAIISIGACSFDPFSERIGAKFETLIDFEDSVKHREVSGSTVKWWLRQSKEAQNAITGGGATLRSALIESRLFITGNTTSNGLRVWSHGATFDIPMLENAYRQQSIEIPWKYFNARDTRTIIDLYPKVKDIPFEGVKHSALSDCIHQIKMIQAVYKEKKL